MFMVLLTVWGRSAGTVYGAWRTGNLTISDKHRIIVTGGKYPGPPVNVPGRRKRHYNERTYEV